MTPLLQVDNLSIDFIAEHAAVNAVKNISFTVNRGEVLAIAGESGSGKTVTSLSILQLLPLSARYGSGKILFSEDGNHAEDLLKKNVKELRKIRGHKIAMIFQEPMSCLNPVFNCGDQVMEALLTHQRLPLRRAKQQVIEWFSKVQLPDPEKIFYRYPHQLSGGQKQRVMIAMAMCCHPSLLICDEPTTALDVTVQKTILQLIRDLQKEENMGVILITHDLGVVAEISDKVEMMFKGEIVEQNSVKEIFTQPHHAYTKALLACRPVYHQRGERLPVVSDKMNEPELKTESFRLKKKVVDFGGHRMGVTAKDVLLKVESLSVSFPSKKNFWRNPRELIKAVDDVSFEIFQGETLGLVGESGCGKTTLARALLRLIEPSAGKIIYKGTDLTAKKRDDLKSFRKDLQIVFQDPYSSLNPRITAGSAIEEPMHVHHNVPGDQKRDKVFELLEKVNLKSEHFYRYPHEFSGGQRQRIVIARALALNPSFLVCDESVSSLDVSVQAQVLNLLNDLKKEFGFTIIFISHDLSVVRYMSDRIMVMNKGRIVESGTADDIYLRPRADYTKKLIASIPKN